MNALFLACFVVHVLQSVLSHPAGADMPRSLLASRFAILIQVPLFLLACVIAAPMGVFSRELVFPPMVIAGLIGGHVVFGFSLLAVHRVVADAWSLFLDLPALFRFLKECPNLIMRTCQLAVTEEIIYRVAGQTLLIRLTGSATAGIVLLAILFCITHRHFFSNGRSEAAEFLAFSVLIGVVYYWSGSLILVTLIHTVRNLEIAHVDYVTQQNDHDGDESAAWQAFESKYGPQGI